jgi:hypothetical protein
VLVRDPARIRLSEIAEAVSAVALAQPRRDMPGDLHRIAQAQHDLLMQYSLRDILDTPPTISQETPQQEPHLPAQETRPTEDPLQ